jgi:hypothetical protein
MSDSDGGGSCRHKQSIVCVQAVQNLTLMARLS